MRFFVFENIISENRKIRMFFIRMIETFMSCILLSMAAFFVLTRRPTQLLMFMLFGFGMILFWGINSFFWIEFMQVIKNWKKFIAVNAGVYLIFAAVMIISYFLTENPRLYTIFFGIFRALEVVDMPTIVSIIITNFISVLLMIVMGFIGQKVEIKENSSKFTLKMSRKKRHF